MFFSFDGIDGVGKTTQIGLFCDWLTGSGQDVVACRDPGSTAVGEGIRRIILHGDEKMPVSLRSEMLLYMAARAQLVEEVIRPALEAGKTVVSDRFVLANVVYQGHAGGLDVETIRQVGDVATGGLLPDCVFLLDMDPADAARRLPGQLDRIEQRGEDYRRRLREGFLAEAARDPERIHVIDAGGSIEQVQDKIRAVAAKMPGMRPGA